MPIEGEIVGGRYRLDGLIGKGGMASVWAGTHIALDRPIAVKFLHVRGCEDNKTLTDQFLREARIAAAVRHRNVIDVLDFGINDQNIPYMVMEVLEGETLGARLVRKPALAVKELIHIVNLTLRGLTVVHDAGIVHRDLKPENIFLQSDDGDVYPKIFDFGISRCLDASGPRSALSTKEGFLVGTPHYMSPEQVRGLRDIDQRTDIYSMGVILYEALTGTLPFDAENIGDLIILIAQETPPEVIELRPEVGGSISDVVTRALHKDRNMRFKDARDMQKSLFKAAEERFGAQGRTISVMPRPNRLSIPNDSQAKDGPQNIEFVNRPIAATDPPKTGTNSSDHPATDSIPKQIGAAQTPQVVVSNHSSTPQSWTIEERPKWLAPKRPWLLYSVLAILVILLIGQNILSLKDLNQSQPSAKEQAHLTSVVVPTAPSTINSPDAAAQKVYVKLLDVPQSATVTVDGIIKKGNSLEFPLDSGQRIIKVTADGMKPWSTIYPGHQNATYRVNQAPMPLSKVSSPKVSTKKQKSSGRPLPKRRPKKLPKHKIRKPTSDVSNRNEPIEKPKNSNKINDSSRIIFRQLDY